MERNNRPTQREKQPLEREGVIFEPKPHLDLDDPMIRARLFKGYQRIEAETQKRLAAVRAGLKEEAEKQNREEVSMNES